MNNSLLDVLLRGPGNVLLRGGGVRAPQPTNGPLSPTQRKWDHFIFPSKFAEAEGLNYAGDKTKRKKFRDAPKA